MTDDTDVDINTPEGLREFAYRITDHCADAYQMAIEAREILFAALAVVGTRDHNDVPTFATRLEIIDALDHMLSANTESSMAKLAVGILRGAQIQPPAPRVPYLRVVPPQTV